MKIAQDVSSSGGVVELIALRGTIEDVEPLVSLQVSWHRGKTEVSWVPVSRDAGALEEVWEAFRGVAQSCALLGPRVSLNI